MHGLVSMDVGLIHAMLCNLETVLKTLKDKHKLYYITSWITQIEHTLAFIFTIWKIEMKDKNIIFLGCKILYFEIIVFIE